MFALLPLDDRPCNLRFPQQIAAIGGSEIITPDKGTLGCFNTPGRARELTSWLEQLPPVDALIASVDMLAYGGLVATRKPAVPHSDALARLEALRGFHQRCPETPIYGFNVLMRLAVTMDSDAAVANYYNVMRYARLADEAERFHSEHLRAELEKVTSDISPAVLREYLAARARNHAINLDMIDWVAEGVFDFLLITQEDATEFGLHRREQDVLVKRVRELGVGDRVSLHPGADEATLTLLARHWNTQARFAVHWSNPADSHRIAPFEDRPYDEALAQHVHAMRGELVNSDADFELFVNAPVGGSQVDEKPAEQAARLPQVMRFARELTEAIENSRRVALCDVAFPNGADNLLMTELDKRGLLGKLTAFGGWNTAGNTTGQLLAQCAAIQRGGEATRRLNRQFLFERLVDDWFYQARVRSQVEKEARDRGISPLGMGEQSSQIESRVRRELRGFAQLLARRHFHTGVSQLEVLLPWRRTFEADIRVELVELQAMQTASRA